MTLDAVILDNLSGIYLLFLGIYSYTLSVIGGKEEKQNVVNLLRDLDYNNILREASLPWNYLCITTGLSKFLHAHQ